MANRLPRDMPWRARSRSEARAGPGPQSERQVDSESDSEAELEVRPQRASKLYYLICPGCNKEFTDMTKLEIASAQPGRAAYRTADPACRNHAAANKRPRTVTVRRDGLGSRRGRPITNPFPKPIENDAAVKCKMKCSHLKA
jgi:hypothetical protein